MGGTDYVILLPHLWWKKHPGWVSHESVLQLLLLLPHEIVLLLLLLLSPEIVLLLMNFCLKSAHLIVNVSPVHPQLNSEKQRD